ncbi:MAG TPA: endonuclease/exonuclease/phosphatase family protein [Spirochaetia bacterium]|nr:endonuclease/exonuclease/phosphatase family protein [Spirochaetales bacterium]HPD80049.1 endonuclease/exonuclease/phosphatase family protein [Spirochaetales bacterium]HQK33672.1 endonuclease/exonuclease/phosphatase family protein [Spirochaetales bacterium]HRS65650.1 endonuclease/exonuclease/phosphatase family protein [Spirochaetia bacterium]HRV28173.1 endonuclease/exonuclease/phosphatase family protein [Spirochaetia bacterium]
MKTNILQNNQKGSAPAETNSTETRCQSGNHCIRKRKVASHSLRRPLAIVLLVMVQLSFFAACTHFETKTETLTLMSYNVEALFDPVDNGNEYREYSVARGTWDDARYKIRLANITAAILAECPQKPDILFVQEIENDRVLKDLSESLGGYAYAIAAPRNGGAITVGIMSKYPITTVKTHQYQTSATIKPSVRLLLEAQLDIRGIPLVVLNAHWKSKKEGAEITEPERRLAAELVKRIINERKKENPNIGIILAGDLNCNPDEYERIGGAYCTALMPQGAGMEHCLEVTGLADAVNDNPLVLYSPWFSAGGFSYWFNSSSERIDNFLLTRDFFAEGSLIAYSGFTAEPPLFLLNESGIPLGWYNETREGYSDHLPIVLTLQMRPGARR